MFDSSLSPAIKVDIKDGGENEDGCNREQP